MFNRQFPPKEVWDTHARVVDKLEATFPDAAAMLDEAAHDVLAFTDYPQAA